MGDNLRIFGKSLLNSYSQVFFSDNRVFAVILLLVSFADIYAGLFGLLAVITTNSVGFIMGFDKKIVAKGLFGFNSLLVALGLGVYYEPSLVLTLIIILASLFTLFVSVSMQGIIGKYGLPYLSIPFIIGAWIVMLAAREFTSLGLSERGIYILNDMYTFGGQKMVNIYEWWNNIEFSRAIRIYFISLGAILFQYNLLAGLIISIGLLLHSRISFTLSLVGFFTAYLFYEITGANISDMNYSYIGFNYILTSIAIGGFFIIPSKRSYLWVILLVPIVAILTISLSSVFIVFSLPVYALPFNIIVLIFLYSLKFRVRLTGKLTEVFIQQNTPEKNLYSYENDILRFRHGLTTIKLPFYGTWDISQGHEGEHTHKGDWRHAWDFIIKDNNGKQFKDEGNLLADYYCYNKPVTAVADGEVEFVENKVPDNEIGSPNIKENWGNTVIIKHKDFLYSSLSHLVPGSVTVKEGDRIKQGDIIGKCGNSGRSPYPHLHFQLQATPYIGSRTIDYPISYYIEHSGERYNLKNFEYPQEEQKISNIEVCDLLMKAFNFVPGRRYSYHVEYNGSDSVEEWEVFTDEYNNSYLSCLSTGSKAYFENDGNLLMFKHYEGKKNDLLYWFYLSAYKLQLGYYNGLDVVDRFPLNLFIRQRILFMQDFLAPFYFFLSSDYNLKYKSIDNELSPAHIELESTVVNRLFGRPTRKVNTMISVTRKGIDKLQVKGTKLNIEAKCKE